MDVCDDLIAKDPSAFFSSHAVFYRADSREDTV
jgi:hypothetical protein